MKTLTRLIIVCGFVLLSAPLCLASHFRYGHYIWTNTSGNTVQVSLQNAFRRDGYQCISPSTLAVIPCGGGDGFPQVGDVIVENIGGTTFNWGDGTAVSSPLGPLLYQITSIDLVNNWWFGLALDPQSLPVVDTTISHTYATAGSYTGYTETCCRISRTDGVNEHINNADGTYRVETVINVGTTRSSPISVLPPIVRCPINAVCSFVVPGVDPNGDNLAFRFSTSSEAGAGFVQPGPPHALNAATINSTTGLFTWNTVGATLASNSSNNTLYSAQVTIQNSTSKVALDFLIELTDEDVTPPIIVPPAGSPPVCNTTQVASVGSTKTFDVVASDADQTDAVTLNVAGLPSGAIMTPSLPRTGNPISSRFSWTPNATQVGQHIISFSATSSSGGFALCPVTINVTNQPSCDPPSAIIPDLRLTGGLVDASISNTRVENGQFVADVTIENSLRGVWLDITRISLDNGTIDLVPNLDAGTAGLMARAGLIPPCEGGLGGLLRCNNPGRAAFKATFCGKGRITIELQQTPRAAALTIIDGLAGNAGLSVNQLLSLAGDLEDEVPLFAEATHCFSPASRSSFACAGNALLRLAKNSEQRNKVVEILRRFGISFGVEEIIKRFTGAAIHLFQTAADGIVFVIQSLRVGTYPSLKITLDGSASSLSVSKLNWNKGAKRKKLRWSEARGS